MPMPRVNFSRSLRQGTAVRWLLGCLLLPSPIAAVTDTVVSRNGDAIDLFLDNLVEAMTPEERERIAYLPPGTITLERVWLRPLIRPLVAELSMERATAFDEYLIESLRLRVVHKIFVEEDNAKFVERLRELKVMRVPLDQGFLPKILDQIPEFEEEGIELEASQNVRNRPPIFEGQEIRGLNGFNTVRFIADRFSCAYVLIPPNRVFFTDFVEVADALSDRLERNGGEDADER